jgi:acetolactate synthase-1/2/3 large subunit
MCEALIRQGVDTIFGIPGGAIMPFYNALWGYRDRLRHVLCRTSRAPATRRRATRAASGRVGVCVRRAGRARPTS